MIHTATTVKELEEGVGLRSVANIVAYEVRLKDRGARVDRRPLIFSKDVSV